MFIFFNLFGLLTYGQCYQLTSPQPLCTEVLKDGQVKVHVSIGSMGGKNSADIIDRFELEYSSDGIFFNTVDIQYIGNKWPMPVKLIHGNATGNSLSAYYRTTAYCDTATNYALPQSEMIKSILLTQRLNSNKHVVLEWNYDEISQNMMMIIDRRQYSNPNFDSLRTLPMTKGPMQFIDSGLTETDTFVYRIAYVNLDNFCQGKSNEVTVFYSKESPSTGIKELPVNQIEIFPNPVIEMLHLNYEMPQSDFVSVRIYNAMGQLMLEPIIKRHTPAGIIKEEISFPSSLSKGMYLIEIQSEHFTSSLPFYH